MNTKICPVYQFDTRGYCGYAAKFSPYRNGKLAIASSANFGIAGSGRLYILQKNQSSQSGYICQSYFDSRDSIYDCCWSELSQDCVIAACGDGTLYICDLDSKTCQLKKAHSREIFSVDWNSVDKGSYATSSWDSTTKIWDPWNVNAGPKRILDNQKGCIYQTKWSPHHADVIASACSDGSVCIYSINQKSPVIDMPQMHVQDVLGLDWNKYKPFVLATSSADGTVKVWDLRKGSQEVCVLHAHKLAVRKVTWSPFSPTILASVSYDTTLRVWDIGASLELPSTPGTGPRHGPLPIQSHLLADNHTEFAVGVDWNLFDGGELVTTGWDQKAFFYKL